MMKQRLSRIDAIFKEQERLKRDRLSGLFVNPQNVNRLKELEERLLREIKELTIILDDGFTVPDNVNDTVHRQMDNVEYLNSIIFNFDSFKRDSLKGLIKNNKEYLRVLEDWRRVYCLFVPSQSYFLDSSFDKGHKGCGTTRKMVSYNRITTTNRAESLKVLTKLIFVEFEKYRETAQDQDVRIMINAWDYRDLYAELEPIKNHILVEYGMFPGEFRMMLKSKAKGPIEEVAQNTYRLNVEALKGMCRYSESFRPREFCAPKSFYSQNRNLKSNTCLFMWYEVKKAFHTLFSTMNQWHATITLVMTIVLLSTK